MVTVSLYSRASTITVHANISPMLYSISDMYFDSLVYTAARQYVSTIIPCFRTAMSLVSARLVDGFQRFLLMLFLLVYVKARWVAVNVFKHA